LKIDKTKVKKAAKPKPTGIRKRQSNTIVKKEKSTAIVKKAKRIKPKEIPTPTKHWAEENRTSVYASTPLVDEFIIQNAWSILGDEEYVLDDEVWNTLYNRIKLQLLKTTYSFRVESEGATLSPYAVTPMPAFRSESAPGYLQSGSFTILRPELPGIIFDLKISTAEDALFLDWRLLRKDLKVGTGHIALYIDGILVEAANFQQGQCRLAIEREDIGDAVFYFLDADTGYQAKILEFNI